MSALTDVFENRLVDWMFRGQAAPTVSTLYVGLLSAAPSDSTGGTEFTGNDYARVAVTSSLLNWAGTQGAGTTVASSGTGGVTSNNNSITFPTPSPSGWGIATHFGIYDALTNGNLLIYGELNQPKSINAGDAIVFPAASLAIAFG